MVYVVGMGPADSPYILCELLQCIHTIIKIIMIINVNAGSDYRYTPVRIMFHYYMQNPIPIPVIFMNFLPIVNIQYKSIKINVAVSIPFCLNFCKTLLKLSIVRLSVY